MNSSFKVGDIICSKLRVFIHNTVDVRKISKSWKQNIVQNKILK